MSRYSLTHTRRLLEIGTSPTSVSRPIAIELPTIKKTTPNSSSSVYTPPAPLSARGDLPGYVTNSRCAHPPACSSMLSTRHPSGRFRITCNCTDISQLNSGYFPLHEEQNRVYRSHPFHLDVSKARERSHRRASETCSLDSLPPPPAPPVTGPAPPPAGVPSFFKMTAQVSAPPPTAASNDSSAHTPVVSYTPSGTNANPLPVGKYYPSNYESRQPEQQFQPHRPSGSPSGALKSDPQLPTLRSDGPAAYARQESEAKRRLQQYQRDMIAHATFALNGGNVNAAALNAITMRNIGFTSVSTKPSKPNIVPLGSPGPVTPLALDTVDDGYLGVRARNSEDHPPKEEVTRAIRAEEERCRREGVSSPALSPVF